MDSSMMNPAMMQAMMQGLQSRSEDPKAQQLSRQQAIADQLRQQSMSTPQGHMAGRVYIPSYEGLGNIAKGYQAQQMQTGIDQGMQDWSKGRADSRSQYLQALIAAMRRQQPETPPMASTTTPMDEDDSGFEY